MCALAVIASTTHSHDGMSALALNPAFCCLIYVMTADVMHWAVIDARRWGCDRGPDVMLSHVTQAGAVHASMDVADYVRHHGPALSEEVSTQPPSGGQNPPNTSNSAVFGSYSKPVAALI